MKHRYAVKIPREDFSSRLDVARLDWARSLNTVHYSESILLLPAKSLSELYWHYTSLDEEIGVDDWTPRRVR